MPFAPVNFVKIKQLKTLPGGCMGSIWWPELGFDVAARVAKSASHDTLSP